VEQKNFMSTVFRLDTSIRLQGSVSRAIASSLESTLEATRVIRRDVGMSPLPSTAWAASVNGGYLPADQRTPEQAGAIALARELADELIAADAYIFATSLYNFGVSQYAKAWVDIVVTDPRFAPGAGRLLAGRPAILVIARGGGYGAGTPRAGWDHATGWLKRIFVDVWGLELEVIDSELTLADVVPQMAELRELAALNLKNAHVAAGEHGKRVSGQLRALDVPGL
jgi:FMN-dependent NADH-azoreductase